MEEARTAISIGNAKEAAIYFDHVVSLVFALDLVARGDAESDITKAEAEAELEAELAFLRLIEPDAFRASREFRTQMLAAQERWLNFLVEITNDPELQNITEGAGLNRYLTALNDVVARQHAPLRTLGLEAAPVVLAPLSLSSSVLVGNEDRAGDIVLTLSNLQLVDASKASWQQVVEFRENPDARRKLRRLRLFAAEDYARTGTTGMEDDLNQRVAEYRQAAQRGGLETTRGSLTIHLTSKAIASGRSGSLLSVIFGKPAMAALAAVRGASVEIGPFTLEVSRRRFALRATLNDNPVSYVTGVEQREERGGRNRVRK